MIKVAKSRIEFPIEIDRLKVAISGLCVDGLCDKDYIVTFAFTLSNGEKMDNSLVGASVTGSMNLPYRYLHNVISGMSCVVTQEIRLAVGARSVEVSIVPWSRRAKEQDRSESMMANAFIEAIDADGHKFMMKAV